MKYDLITSKQLLLYAFLSQVETEQYYGRKITLDPSYKRKYSYVHAFDKSKGGSQNANPVRNGRKFNLRCHLPLKYNWPTVDCYAHYKLIQKSSNHCFLKITCSKKLNPVNFYQMG